MDVTKYTAFFQAVIFFSVLIVWAPMSYNYWKHQTIIFSKFSAVSWGFCLLLISLWRTFSSTTTYFGTEVIGPTPNAVILVIVWGACASITFMNAVVWYRGEAQ